MPTNRLANENDVKLLGFINQGHVCWQSERFRSSMKHMKFSLKFMLVGLTICAVALAIFAPILRRTRTVTTIEANAVQSINQSEWCLVTIHEYGFPEGTAFVLSIHVQCPQPDSELLRIAPLLAKLRRVDCYAPGTRLTDVGLRELHSVTTLQELLVDDTMVTSRGLQDLKKAVPGCRLVHKNRTWYSSD